MAETATSEGAEDFRAAVAARATLPSEVTERILDDLGIRAQGALPRPRSLVLTGVRFTADDKTGDAGKVRTFDWPLGPGVWALASSDNLVGKSSVLNVLLWALRGSPGRLQADIRGSLREVDVTFTLDRVLHRVSFSCVNGRLSGTVKRASGSRERTVASFNDERAFSHAMDEVMREALGLERLSAWQSHANSEDGQIVSHGWSAYTGALVIAGAEHQVLLGEVEMGGMPGRLLQMFVGVPWATTAAQAKAKLDELNQAQRNVTRRQNDDEAARKGIEAELQKIVERLRAQRAALGDAAAIRKRLEDAFRALKPVHASLLAAQRALAQARATAKDARDHRAAEKARLLDAEETRLARRFFDALDPSCCPRCEAKIDAVRRKREKTEEACSVCASPLAIADDEPAVLESLAQAAKAAEHAVSAADRVENQAVAALDAAERVLTATNETYDRLLKEPALTELTRLDQEIARAEGALNERRRTREAVGGRATVDDAPQRIAVAKAAVAEADSRSRAAAETMFQRVDDEIVRLAKDFGMKALEAVKLDRAARLAVVKGGTNTWFSKLTAGERLRLRVATVVAMLRVGKDHGVGRHPGVLLLDSAGAEEASQHDAGELVRELVAVATEVPNLQILLTTARPDLLAGNLDIGRVRIAKKGSRLW